MEATNIDVKKVSPNGYGNCICFRVYCGYQVDFGNGKSCVWVDMLYRGEYVLSIISPFWGFHLFKMLAGIPNFE